MAGDNNEQKEEHRIGTINRWDAPDDDWAAEYDWTRFRGPDPWPVPGGWTFGDPEEGGWWIYFGDAGVGHGNDNGILDELQEDESIDDAFDAMNELREEHGQYASLTARTANPDEVSMMNPKAEKLEWELEVDGAQVFRRVEPDRDDLLASVAEALDAYHEGREDRFEEIVPETGRKPDDVLEQEEQERREEENDSLDEYVTDGGVEDPEHAGTYRFVVACKECGVCDDETFPAEAVESEQPISMDRKPGFLHYDRTGHTCVEINYDVAPYDIQKMLDDGRLEVLDFERLAEAATGQADAPRAGGSA